MSQAWIQESRVAITAVRSAAKACRAVRQQLVNADTLEKRDRSPVTVADFASQAIVCAHLQKALADDLVVAEEDAAELRHAEQAPIRTSVVRHVAEVLGQQADDEQVLSWIDRGGAGWATDQTPVKSGSNAPPGDRFWTLDPIDGTKGFLRNEQYAVALALINDGRVVLGVLGCPNLPHDSTTGALLIATRGQGAKLLPLWDDSLDGQPVSVSQVSATRDARFCESVESGHSSHSDAARIAEILGITTEPVRMDSQAKYATVARGEASVYLRLPTRADYEEKIWDHAAGSIVVEEAGGRVTDIHGKPLDFTQGRTLKHNRGIVATNRLMHDDVVRAVQQVCPAT